MSPLPLVAIAFVTGVALAPARGSDAAAGCALAALALAGVGALGGAKGRRRFGAIGGAALVLAAGLAGLARGAEVPSVVPRPRALVEGGLLAGVVLEGCVRDDATARCIIARDGDGARVALSAPASSCAALPGERVTAVAMLRAVAPDANGARLGPGGAMYRRGVRWTAAAAGCERGGGAGGVLGVGPLALARRAGLAVRAELGRGLARALPAPAQAHARALLFGDERGVAADEVDAFRDSGLAHLLAVSGAHVALLAALLAALVRGVARRVPALAARGLVAPLAALAPLPALAVFVLATGESPSALRALLGAALAAPALAGGRRVHGEALVGATAIATLAVAPGLVRDPGWQLSIVASWALAARAVADEPDDDPAHVRGAPTRGARAHLAAIGRAVLAGWAEALATSARVALAAAPVLAWHFQRAPATAIAANALAAPLAEAVALPLVLGVALAGSVSSVLGGALGALAAPLLAALFAMPRVALALPLASLTLPPPTPAEAWTCVLVAVALLRARGARARLAWAGCALLACGALEWAHLGAVHPRGVLRVTALDVGQGDAVLVDLPDGAAMLVDGGGGNRRDAPDPGARVVVPALGDRRRRSLSVVIASHPHPDHVGGLAAVMGWAHVGALWDTRQGESAAAGGGGGEGRVGSAPGGAYARLRAVAAARRVTVAGPEEWCGPPRAFHGVELEVLAPCPGVVPGDAPNDASLVVRLAFGRARVLLAGDLERAGEARVIPRLRAAGLRGAGGPTTTVLKVAHHGSRTSSTEAFLAAARPRVALVSAGHPSPFDHPHLEALARLRAAGATVLSTATDGAVSATLWPDGRVQAGRWVE